MINLNYYKALQLLEQVVAGNEDLVYIPHDPNSKFCSYVAGSNTHGCGVGQVFRRADVRTLDLRRLDHVGSVINIVRECAGSSIVSMDEKTQLLLSEFQYHQDRGKTWGHALTEAKAFVSRETIND